MMCVCVSLVSLVCVDIFFRDSLFFSFDDDDDGIVMMMMMMMFVCDVFCVITCRVDDDDKPY